MERIILGKESGVKANTLASQQPPWLKEVFKGIEEVRIARPVKKAELRLSGLDDSVTAAEVVQAVVKAGGCEAEITTGDITSLMSIGTVWVHCISD